MHLREYHTPPPQLYPSFLSLSQKYPKNQSIHQQLVQSQQHRQPISPYLAKQKQLNKMKNNLLYSYDFSGQQITSSIKNRLKNKPIYIPEDAYDYSQQGYLPNESNSRRLDNPELRPLLKNRLNIFREQHEEMSELQRLDFQTLHEIDELNERNYKMLNKPLKIMFRDEKKSNRLETQGRSGGRARKIHFQDIELPTTHKLTHLSRQKQFQKYINYLQHGNSPTNSHVHQDRSRMITQPKRQPLKTPQYFKSAASQVIQGSERRVERYERVLKVLRMVKNRGESLLTKLTKYPSLRIVKKT